MLLDAASTAVASTPTNTLAAGTAASSSLGEPNLVDPAAWTSDPFLSTAALALCWLKRMRLEITNTVG